MLRLLICMAGLTFSTLSLADETPAAARTRPTADTVEATGVDDAALAIADGADSAPTRARDGRGLVEYGFSRAYRSDGGPPLTNHRVSLDTEWSGALSTDWRLTFANRLDVTSEPQTIGSRAVNTAKELYASWRVDPHWLVDAGRINLRYGAGIGYNPTDFFRDGALRTIVSVDPTSLRTNRMGSVVLRQQWLWDTGSVTGVYSPKLATRHDPTSFSLDLDATNHEHRWLVALTQRLAENLSPQFLLYQEYGRPLQAGSNLSVLVGGATIVFAEWSGGKGRSLMAEMTQAAGPEQFRSRGTAGLTYTAPHKLTLSAEYEYNGSGLDNDAWAVLGQSKAAHTGYRAYARARQELPTRHALFASARWDDAMFDRFDLVGLVRLNLDDRSRMWWLEGIRHFDHTDLILQLQQNRGGPRSEFGAALYRSSWQLLVRHHF